MDSKLLWTSKTFIINLIALIAMAIQTQTGFIIDAEAQAAIWGVLNIIIRIFTTQAVTIK